jgi:RNA polymerase sigma-70 factor (sigma-E family)
MMTAVGTLPGDTGEIPAVVGADFDAFYTREYPSLVRLAYVLTGSRAVAEELVQETMLRAFRHWGRIADYERPGAWARRVLVNLATSRGRRLTAEARAMSRLRARPPEPALAAETVELWAAVRRLPARQAQVTALAYLEDRPIAEIAQMLGIAEGTVKAVLHRARGNLARALGLKDEEDGDG